MEAAEVNFSSFGLDNRIEKAISKLGWVKPTPVQTATIPLALEGKDVVARAKTGSGKTASYLIPIIQKVIQRKQLQLTCGTGAVILLPSKELCKQCCGNFVELTSYCSKDARALDIGNGTVESCRPLLLKTPDVLISTPSKLIAHLNNKTICLKDTLEILIIDEADLMMSFGYEQDFKILLEYLPKLYQAILVSATMSDDVYLLKKMLLHNPAILKLEESQLPEEAQLSQYVVKCEPDDKFLLMYTLLKLKLLRGKSLIFVNKIQKCYKLKLFLEQFSISSCVINSELPQNSRVHIVEEFNKGIYDIVIATDESISVKTNVTTEDDKPAKTVKQKAGQKSTRKDSEYGVSRGIDFQEVENVVNFDFPEDPDSYIHRVGRTARGDSTGTALSIITAKDEPQLKEVEMKITGESNDSQSVLKPYLFKMDEIEGFRYRVNDALRAVTKIAVKEARLKEIRSEIVNSQKLKAYFEDNPKDLQVLRHDRTLHPTKVQPHMKNVPDYLVPQTLKPTFAKQGKKRKHWVDFKQDKKAQFKKKKDDPLKSFKFDKGKKSKKHK